MIEITDPCIGCPNINLDEYGYLCDIACGKRSAWLNYMAGIREVVEAIIKDTGNFEVPLSLGLITKLKEWEIVKEDSKQ